MTNFATVREVEKFVSAEAESPPLMAATAEESSADLLWQSLEQDFDRIVTQATKAAASIRKHEVKIELEYVINEMYELYQFVFAMNHWLPTISLNSKSSSLLDVAAAIGELHAAVHTLTFQSIVSINSKNVDWLFQFSRLYTLMAAFDSVVACFFAAVGRFFQQKKKVHSASSSLANEVFKGSRPYLFEEEDAENENVVFDNSSSSFSSLKRGAKLSQEENEAGGASPIPNMTATAFIKESNPTSTEQSSPRSFVSVRDSLLSNLRYQIENCTDPVKARLEKWTTDPKLLLKALLPYGRQRPFSNAYLQGDVTSTHGNSFSLSSTASVSAANAPPVPGNLLRLHWHRALQRFNVEIPSDIFHDSINALESAHLEALLELSMKVFKDDMNFKSQAIRYPNLMRVADRLVNQNF